MIWTMLNVMCLFVCVMAAGGAAMAARGGFGSWTLAAVLGLLLGTASDWAMWKTGERVGSAIQLKPEPRQELYLNLLYFAAVLWIVLMMVIADHVTSAAVHLVG